MLRRIEPCQRAATLTETGTPRSVSPTSWRAGRSPPSRRLCCPRSPSEMRELRATLRDLIPTPLRRRYHRHAVLRDFGINLDDGSRRQTQVDPRISRGLNVIGYFQSPTGLGQSARSLAAAVEDYGIPVRRIEASTPPKRNRQEQAYDVNLFHVNADASAAVVEEM